MDIEKMQKIIKATHGVERVRSVIERNCPHKDCFCDGELMSNYSIKGKKHKDKKHKNKQPCEYYIDGSCCHGQIRQVENRIIGGDINGVY